MGGFFLNDETYENNDTFLYIILEYDRPNFDRFLHRAGYLNCLARNSLSESTEIVKSSNFNYSYCHLLPTTMT